MTPSRIFLLFLVFFIFGVAVRWFFNIPLILFFPFFLIAATAMIFDLRERKKKYIFFVLTAFAFALGVFRYDQVHRRVPDLSLYYGTNVILSGVVTSEPEYTGNFQRVHLAARPTYEITPPASFGVLLTTRSYPRYGVGDELEVEGRLDDPHDAPIPRYADRLLKESIFATMYFPGIEKTSEGNTGFLISVLLRIKHAFEEKIDLILPEPHAAFLKGLLLGERQDLPQSLRDNFAITGTTHIVALSGYNITLVGGFFMGALLFLTVPFSLAFWLSTSAIILFVLLTGASPSVVRAGIMGILLLIAQKEGRFYHIGNALAFAAAVMIWANPMVLRFDVAFELSFLATIGLSYLSPVVENLFSFLGNKAKKIIGFNLRHNALSRATGGGAFSFRRTLVETVAAQIAVLPLLIYLFGRFSLVSPVTNLLILIAVPYAMAVGFVAGCAAFFSLTLGRVIGVGAWILLEYMIRIIELFSRLPFASVTFDPFAGFFAAAAIGAALFYYLWRRMLFLGDK